VRRREAMRDKAGTAPALRPTAAAAQPEAAQGAAPVAINAMFQTHLLVDCVIGRPAPTS